MNTLTHGLRTLGVSARNSRILSAISPFARVLAACTTMVVATTHCGAPSASGPAVSLLVAGTFTQPQDSCPDGTGTNIYFIATNGAGARAVFRVAGTGGTATELFAGAPLVRPTGIVLSSDGQKIYIADPDAMTGGVLFSMPIAGAMPSPVMQTVGTHPTALDVTLTNGVEAVYFTGQAAMGGAKGVFKWSAESVRPVAMGAPFVDPAGVTVGPDNTVYVADRTEGNVGTVYRVPSGGQPMPILTGESLGNPPGIALTPDDKQLMVSSVDPMASTARVVLVDLITLRTSVFSDTIRSNLGAGGLHRAFGNHRTMAWAGRNRQYEMTDSIYRVQF